MARGWGWQDCNALFEVYKTRFVSTLKTLQDLKHNKNSKLITDSNFGGLCEHCMHCLVVNFHPSYPISCFLASHNPVSAVSIFAYVLKSYSII